MALSYTIFELYDVEECRDLGNDNIRYIAYELLFVVRNKLQWPYFILFWR